MQPTPVTPAMSPDITLSHGPLITMAAMAPAAAAVVDAEAELVEALLRLRDIKRAALFGTTYNADDYDAAIFAYRHARAAAEEARERWERSLPLSHASVA